MSREGLPLSEVISVDRGQAAWVLLINDSDQCLGHGEGTIVKADIGHFTLLIKTFVIKTSHSLFDFLTCKIQNCPLGGDKPSKEKLVLTHVGVWYMQDFKLCVKLS